MLHEADDVRRSDRHSVDRMPSRLAGAHYLFGEVSPFTGQTAFAMASMPVATGIG